MSEHPTEVAYQNAIDAVVEAKRALFKESARRPALKVSAIATLMESGYKITEAKDLHMMEPEYAKHKQAESEAELAVIQAEALAETRKAQMYRSVYSLLQEQL